MSPYRRNVLVGITVLGAMAILAWMILQFGGRVIGPFTTAKMRIGFASDRADGLSDGSAVVYHGVNVGQITEVRLDPDQRHVHIFADVLTKPPLPANLEASIKTSGLIGTGAQLILDTPAGEAPKGVLAKGQELTARFVGLADFIPPEFTKLAEDLRKTSAKFRESHFIDDLDEQIKHVGRMMDSIQNVVDDPKMRKDLNDSIANMRTATETVNRIGINIEKFSKDLDKLSNDTSGTMNEARATIQKTQGHIDDLAKQTGERLQQVSTLLGEFQSIAGKIDKGEGTAGQLLNDPKLYQSMVDTTRELNATISDLKRVVEQWEQEGISLKVK